jgi:hypothetical protein
MGKGEKSMSEHNFLNTKVGVTVIGLLTLLSVVTQAAAQGQSAQALARAKDAKERHVQDLMDRLGAVGVGVGLNPQGEVAIKIFVALINFKWVALRHAD